MSIKKLFLCLILILVCVITKAQHTEPGTIFKKNGEVLNVDIGVYQTGIIINERKIRYYSANSKNKILISNIDSIKLNQKTYRIISYKKERKTGPNNGIKTFTLLTEVINDGPIKLYRAYQLNSSTIYQTSNIYLAENNYLIKGDSVKWINKIDFNESIKSYFPDCDFSEKIDKKNYNYTNLEEVVAYGNLNCIKKSKSNF